MTSRRSYWKGWKGGLRRLQGGTLSQGSEASQKSPRLRERTGACCSRKVSSVILAVPTQGPRNARTWFVAISKVSWDPRQFQPWTMGRTTRSSSRQVDSQAQDKCCAGALLQSRPKDQALVVRPLLGNSIALIESSNSWT